MVPTEDIWWFPRKKCGGSRGGHELLATEDMWWFPWKTWGGCHGGHVLVLTGRTAGSVQDSTGLDGTKFGRTHLRITVSKAKFDARADGGVHLAVQRLKNPKICKK